MRARYLLLLALAACATAGPRDHKPPLAVYTLPPDPPAPTLPTSSAPVYIRGATVMTAAGPIYSPGYVLLHNGVIEAVGATELSVPSGTTTVDGRGLYVTPGIIDTHSHMGVAGLPNSVATDDVNEATSPTTPELWAQHSFWPQDPALWRALESGVTTIQVLPGSANLIGGRSFIAHTLPRTTPREMEWPGAVQGLKMACGENPKRVYGGERHTSPSTRMGNVAGYRATFQKAVEYRRKWQKYDRDLEDWQKQHGHQTVGKDDIPDPPEPPERNLGLETLEKVLDGSIVVQCHCYRADEMAEMIDISHEFGFHIRSFHHALEAYKIRDLLAKEGIGVSTWTDWGGFKLEAFDSVPQNAALLTETGVRVALHSDSEIEIRHLNQEAGKAQTAGRKLGINISDNDVLRWVTANPAWILGLDSQVGTLEAGKRADVVVWDHKPFSVYARPTQVYIDGTLVYDRSKSPARPLSDFEVGNNGEVP